MQQGYRNVQSRRRTRSSMYQRGKEPASHSGFLSILLCICIVGGTYLYFNQKAFHQVMNEIEKGRGYIENIIQTKILKEEVKKESKEEQITYYAPLCLEANVAKIIASTLFEEELAAQNQFQETLEEEWYGIYYEVLKSKEQFSFLSKENAMKTVSLESSYDLLQKTVGDAFKLNTTLNENTKDAPITIKQFLEMYHTIMEKTEIANNMIYKELSILGTPATLNDLGAWRVLTDKGEYSFKGLMLDAFKDYTVKVALVNEEILGMLEVIKEESTLLNCTIQSVESDEVKIALQGETYTYVWEEMPQQLIGQVVNLTVKNGKVISYEMGKEEAKEVVLRVTDDYVEFKEAGKVLYEEVEVVDESENGNRQSIKQLLSGMKVNPIIEEGVLKKVEIMENPSKETMRVLISEDGIGEYKHTQLSISSQKPIHITYNEKTFTLKEEEKWESKDFSWEKGMDKIVIWGENNEPLQVESIDRRGQTPEYVGTLEVYKEEDGFYVVNEVDIEDYIAGVIGSEMPTSYGLEAAKVQAVAARSYALAHQSSTKYTKYGAQVDDTTSTQVYNHVKTDEIAQFAARETAKEVLQYNDQIISGNFFAASCGSTANFGEVWASLDTFPSNTPIYLVANKQYTEEDSLHLNDEKDAYLFFTTPANQMDAFDNHSPWFRWQLALTREEVEQIITDHLYSLTVQYPSLVKVLDNNNEWVSQEIDEIGVLENIEVKKRGEGGNIMELVVEGSKESVKISTEYLIRSLFAPVQNQAGEEPFSIIRADGSRVENMSMLPSAFFIMDMSRNNENTLEKITFYGGGFGHGVGMSQEGVKGMVERGYTYKEILEHYYRNIEIDVF